MEKVDEAWRYSDAGALYYACAPKYYSKHGCIVVLRENRFVGNTAENKGGAARWVNRNFTLDANLLLNKTIEKDQNNDKSNRRLSIEEAQNDTNVYIDNYANYGPNLASYPKSLRYSLTGETGSIGDIPNGD